MSDDELVLFFRHNNQKLCGRFAKHQLNRSLGRVPQQSRAARWWKAATLLPLTFFGKNVFAQQIPVPAADSVQQVEADTSASTVFNDSIVADSADCIAEEPLVNDTLTASTDTQIAEPIVVKDVIVVPQVISIDGPFSIEPGDLMGVVAPMRPEILVHWYDVLTLPWFVSPEKKSKSAIEATDPNNIADAETPERKEEPKVPVLPEAPWYAAILPDRIRIRKKS